MITLLRTDADHPDFRSLVAQLDAALEVINGDAHAFFAPFNKVDTIKNALVAYDENQRPVGSGAIKPYDPHTMEVKRMYVPPDMRSQGVASIVLAGLEAWAAELGYQKCILETGRSFTEAIGLYRKNGYVKIPNYGQYAGNESSICFEKGLMRVDEGL